MELNSKVVWFINYINENPLIIVFWAILGFSLTCGLLTLIFGDKESRDAKRMPSDLSDGFWVYSTWFVGGPLCLIFHFLNVNGFKLFLIWLCTAIVMFIILISHKPTLKSIKFSKD